MKKSLNKILMVFIPLLLLSCGKVTHSGQVDHVFSLNVEQLEGYFRASCVAEVPEALVEACVNKKVGDFLTVLAALGSAS